jgi:WD40 repeat protein
VRRLLRIALFVGVPLVAGCLTLIDKAIEIVFWSPSLRSLAFSPDGSVLAVGLSVRSGSQTTGGVRLLDAVTRRRQAEFPVDYEVTRLTFTRDGKSLFLDGHSVSWRGGCFWAGSIPPLISRAFGWFDLSGEAVRRDLDLGWEGRKTLVCSGDGGAVAWRTAAETTIQVQSLFPEQGPARSVQVPIKEKAAEVLALATERGPLAYADADNQIHVVELQKLQEMACLRGHERPVRALLFSVDGKRLFSAAGDDFDRPSEVIVWDVPGQRVRQRLPGLNGPFNRFFLSEDGRYLAIGVRAVNESTDLTVWDVESGEEIYTATYLAYGTPAAFSPDGRRLAVVEYSGEVKILDLQPRNG